MNRIKGLLRDTWWLWIIFFVAGVLLTALVNLIFIVTFPILVFTLIYYATIRYDDDGNARSDL